MKNVMSFGGRTIFTRAMAGFVSRWKRRGTQPLADKRLEAIANQLSEGKSSYLRDWREIISRKLSYDRDYFSTLPARPIVDIVRFGHNQDDRVMDFIIEVEEIAAIAYAGGDIQLRIAAAIQFDPAGDNRAIDAMASLISIQVDHANEAVREWKRAGLDIGPSKTSAGASASNFARTVTGG